VPLSLALSLWIHRASFAASEQAIYLASVLDVATTLCLADFQEIMLLYNMKRYPEVDLQVSLSPAQSESINPVILVLRSSVTFAIARLL